MQSLFLEGKCSQFHFVTRNKQKANPIQCTLNATHGATEQQLKENDLIRASPASPLTHCIEAIC